MTPEQVLTVATQELASSGLKGELTEDQRSLILRLVEQDVNKRIVAKGKELGVRTQNLFEQLKAVP